MANTQSNDNLSKIKLNGIEFAYNEYGNKNDPRVLFAHGAGQTRHAWSASAKELSEKGFRTIVVDSRGHGDSGWSVNQAYSIQDFASDLIDITDFFTTGDDGIHIVGASLGGISALVSEGLLRPGTFSSITLVDITPSMNFSGVEKIMGFMSSNSSDGFDSLEQASEVISSYLPHREQPKNLNGLKKNLRQKSDGRWYWHWDPAFITSLMTQAREEQAEQFDSVLETIKIPIHLVRGRMSELVTEASVEHFMKLAPHAHYTDVADARHMIAGDSNEAFNSAIVSFLQQDDVRLT